jgi:glucose dehydrogenase
VPDTVNYSGSVLGGIPLIKPPYAYLVAVDLNKGDIAWKVPFGVGSQAMRDHPLLQGVKLPERLGTGGPAGVLVTKSGLILIGGGDPFLYAFDKATGEELWRVPTPFRTSGNPMTYRTRSGRQFVVIATGGGSDATLTAFALRSR